jgi:hypothetical protein
MGSPHILHSTSLKFGRSSFCRASFPSAQPQNPEVCTPVAPRGGDLSERRMAMAGPATAAIRA